MSCTISYIEYKDSGVGFETSSLNTLNPGFGMKLIQSVLKQIKANFELHLINLFIYLIMVFNNFLKKIP